MSADNVTPILPPKDDGSEPARRGRPKAPKHDVAELTFRTEENDIDVSLVLLALRYQFEAIEYALDTEGNDTKASYLALGGVSIVQGLIERMDTEKGP
jgi:hypothetical protein